MEEADRDKLIKMLRMFGSNHDGEVCNAARQVEKLVKSRALDWGDLIIPIHPHQHQQQYRAKSPPPPPPPPDADDEFELIRECQESGAQLTPWETEFLESIAGSILQWGRLTEKQRAVLDRIVLKVNRQRNPWQETF